MSRLVWVGVGAAGGIYAYRRSQRAWERTKERGVAGNTAALTRTATAIYRGIKTADDPEVMDLTLQGTTVRIDRGQADVEDPQLPPPSPTRREYASSAATKAGTAAAARLIGNYRRSAS